MRIMKFFTAATIMALGLSALAQDTIHFTWDVYASTLQKSFDIRTTNGETFTIDWGDNQTEPQTGQGSTITINHTYATVGTYNVKIIADNTNCRFIDLYCNNNFLSSLDVSNCTDLAELMCSDNLLTNLDVGNCTALTILNCSFNFYSLSSLDVSKCTALTNLYCYQNQLSAAALNALFETLHSNVGVKNVIIRNNPGTNDCDRSIAERKGWRVSR